MRSGIFICGTVLAIALAGLPLPCRAQSGSNTDGVAAIVNEDVITFSDVRSRVQEQEKQLAGSGLRGTELVDRIKELRLDALRSLIERRLIIQEFKAKEFFIPDNVIEDQVSDVIRKGFGGDRPSFIRTLREQGMTLEQFKQRQREEFMVQVMQQRYVAESVIISPFKIEEYYQRNAREFLIAEQVELRQIYLRRGVDPASGEVDPQKNLADEIVTKLDSGSDFSELARSFSQGAGRSDGGMMGWVSRDALRKELADVVFALHPGEHSRVVETDDGYYILQVEDSKKQHMRPIEEVRDEIERRLGTEERRELRERWLNTLRAKAYIKMF
jgi:parvulin-like peptidyl-prolyl isomerase